VCSSDLSKAQASLNQVIEQYPDTSASRLAKVRLDRIQQNAQ
jgi:TolA-binding protein